MMESQMYDIYTFKTQYWVKIQSDMYSTISFVYILL